MSVHIPTIRQRRTKIVATIGPATRDASRLRELIEAGVDVVRLNFSHGTHDEHKRVIVSTRKIAKELGRPVAILQDLQGPRLRIEAFKDSSVTLRPGQTFTLTTRPVQGTIEAVTINYPKLPAEARPGNVILIDDGHIRLQVTRVNRTDVICRVETGGALSSRKGVNLPGVNLSTPSFTEKDMDDLELGMRMGVDFVALSFVRTGKDAKAIRDAMTKLGGSAPVIAKIEWAQAVEHVDDILKAFDGVMVARGDLGVEIGAEHVPLIQKRIIRKANELMKPVITATQMLESMVNNPSPTRAEASDVANAILDGTDAVMLSAETSIGSYPLEAVRFMDRIACEADEVELPFRPSSLGALDPSRAVVHAAHELAQEVKAKAIALFTTSGRTGVMIAKHRPNVPAIAFTRGSEAYQRLALCWGITPVQTPFTVRTNEMITYAEDVLIKAAIVKAHDRVIIVGSAPLAAKGQTNFLKVHTVKEQEG